MPALTWDVAGTRLYETGVDHGVLYVPNATTGAYDDGVAWNGLVSVTETPSGAEPTKLFADNIAYINLFSAESFGGTLEAFMYPDEFAQFDGFAIPQPGVMLAQQGRKTFGLSYRTMLGNDIEGSEYGYKLHLLYGLTASPSEKAYNTVNESPEAITFSWALSSIPAAVTGYRPVSLIVINSVDANATDLAALEAILYGGAADPKLPTPDEVLALFAP